MDEIYEICGFDLLGADDAVVTIPTAGATYSDAKTVASVQAALVKKGYSVGKSGVDGLFGPDTKTAILKMQADAGIPQTGKIDEGVIMALGVTPGVLQPGVTLQGKAAVQAQVALDAATAAEHAETPSDVQIAAQQAVDAAPPAPPELKQDAQKALVKAKAAKTPAQVQDAASDVADAAHAVNKAVAPSWWSVPAWDGGYPRWQVALAGSFALLGVGGGVYALKNK